MKLTNILDRPIAFHRCLVDIAGSVTSALFLGQAIYWTNRTNDSSGWFWKTADEWFSETGLTRREQETVRKGLKDRKLLEEKLVGVPATLHFRINIRQLESSLADLSKLDSTKAPNLIQQNVETISTETTSGERESNSIPPFTRQEFDDLIRLRGWTKEFGDYWWNELEIVDWTPKGRFMSLNKVQVGLWLSNRWVSWRSKTNGKSVANEIQKNKRRDILKSRIDKLKGELQYDWQQKDHPELVKELADLEAQLEKLENEILHAT